jgi:hypothetical protein
LRGCGFLDPRARFIAFDIAIELRHVEAEISS